MDLDKLKADWQNQSTANLSLEEMQELVRSGKHPGLVRSRKVLLIESAAWAAFLLLFYDAFDGHEKPWWLNALLIFAFLVLLAHHLMGIWLLGQRKVNESLASSMAVYRGQLQQFIRLNFIGRLLAMATLLLFFLYGLEWNTKRLLISVGFLVVMFVQFYMLRRFWQERLASLDQYYLEED